jgi:hypothetical protein
MPGAARAIARDEALRDPNTAAPRVEHVKVYMPHELPEGERGAGCVPGLTEMEAKMRGAQCTAALTVLRGRLHAKRHFITFRNDHLTGQKKTTKAGTLIAQLGERVNVSAGKYRKGYEGLVALKGKDFAPHFRELNHDDIRLDGDNGESDAAARKKLAMLSAGRGARAPRNAPGQSKRLMSWIWTVKEGSGDDEKDLHDGEYFIFSCSTECITMSVSCSRGVGTRQGSQDTLGGRSPASRGGNAEDVKVFGMAGFMVGDSSRRAPAGILGLAGRTSSVCIEAGLATSASSRLLQVAVEWSSCWYGHGFGHSSGECRP